jgi:hypothetical protein
MNTPGNFPVQNAAGDRGEFVKENKPATSYIERAEAPAEKPKTLAQKILEIQDRVGVVKKQGKFGSEMGGGNYLRIEDAVVAVNKLMTANKLILIGEVIASERIIHERTGKDGITGRSGYISGVTMRWTLEDTENSDHREYVFRGDGYDSTDKSIYKAMTGCRKYAIINIFNLPIGNDVEEHGTVTFEEGKEKQRKIASNKVAEAASRGVPSAIDAMSQVEPEKKLIITRPEDYNGHYILASGLIAVPQLQTFFEDTDCKFIKSKQTGKVAWKVPENYEKGLLALCEKLNIEVEG